MAVTCEMDLARTVDAIRIALLSRNLIEHGLPWSWTPQRIRGCIRHPEYVVMVARAQNAMAGFGVMHYLQQHAHLCLLGVEPAFQRMGIGRRMMEWLEETARVAGIFDVVLEVRTGNGQAALFYESLGYRTEKEVRRYYSSVENAVRMRRSLKVG
ncbi:MAG: GNAT family N-acetyltransferase [Xanthomonadales bacterium]|nr:GNAT family N-acetyltransferase [Xanthomonadales bacterium]